ncbi:hypothetical protein EFO83_05970 [Lacticaseibacillus rhamnosus]|nr:hypothetical protein [Lacticaseibacillus rhamnosus]MCT3372436.1 hypothetical protein [Lacticaseibacillus rhamnosus]PTR95231.1 hypothetical protein DBP95_13670 [Lacticaseibacillus rhamnosus]PTS02019.1 hypothetical protein DBQ08_12860 [Lacticaseibacillus rhamnosus]QEW13556.1 hypothetical protein F5976_12430 [Lacticaseibacillus rhamnosus]
MNKKASAKCHSCRHWLMLFCQSTAVICAPRHFIFRSNRIFLVVP